MQKIFKQPKSAKVRLGRNRFSAAEHVPSAGRLNFGAGWRNTTLALAQLGFEVTALDIEPRFCELIGADSSFVSVGRGINDDFYWIERAAVSMPSYFELFHHYADHLRFLRISLPALASDGRVYFGASHQACFSGAVGSQDRW